MEEFARAVLGKGGSSLAIAACAVAASGCGSGMPAGLPPASPSSEKTPWVAVRFAPLPTHRVTLSRSWTPSTLTEITDRIDPHRGVSVAAVYRRRVPAGNPRGWWFVWKDPTPNSQADGMLDYWTAQIAGRLYQARRELSAPKLSGIQLDTRVPSSTGDWADGENSRWWGRTATSYVQARPAALRAHIRRAAAKLGLTLRSFRAPRLNGILAPVVALQVSNEAKFERWYTAGCSEGWMVGTRADTDGAPYFGFFLTIDDSSGGWLGSVAASPNGTESGYSAEEHKLFPPHIAPGQIGGMSACPAKFR